MKPYELPVPRPYELLVSRARKQLVLAGKSLKEEILPSLLSNTQAQLSRDWLTGLLKELRFDPPDELQRVFDMEQAFVGELETHLDSGEISEGLHNQFESHGLKLPSQARVAVADKGRRNWQIDVGGKMYHIRGEPARVGVYTSDLRVLADYGEQLYRATETLALYIAGYEQMRAPGIPAPSVPGMDPGLRAGRKIATDLYNTVVDGKGLQLNRATKDLTVIPFINRLYSGGFTTALPYIVTPRWGYTQSWAWPGYVHEVAHHLYRNVKGLAEEIQAKLTTALALGGQDFISLSLWFRWGEEIFADATAAMLLGPTFVQTQQYGALSFISQDALRSLDRSEDSLKALLCESDPNHPTAYIRVYLALRVLSLLGHDVKELLDRWDGSFADRQISTAWLKADVSLSNGDRQLGRGLKSKQLKEQGDRLIELLLDTPLDALADAQGKAHSIRAIFHNEADQTRIAKSVAEFQKTMDALGQTERLGEALRRIDDQLANGIDSRLVIAIAVCAFESLEVNDFWEFNDHLIKRVASRVASL